MTLRETIARNWQRFTATARITSNAVQPAPASKPGSARLKVRGRLTLFIDGVQVASHSNLVVDTGLDAIWDCFMGDGTKVITHMCAGTGTTAPAAGDTSLQAQTFTKALTSMNLAATGNMYVTFDIIPGEATGTTFTEFGLKCQNTTTLVARWVDGAGYLKTAGNTISGTWDLYLVP